MATETVVSDHPAPCEGVEKEEVKKIEAEIASQPPKETPCAETEAKIKEEPIEPRVEHVKGDEEAKTVIAAPAAEQKIEDKAVCVEAPPAGDESIIEKEAAAPETTPQEKVDDNKPVVDDKKVEDVVAVEAPKEAEAEPAEKLGEEKCGESSEGKLEEPEKVAVVAESAPAEVIEKKEETKEEAPLEVVEATKAKEAAAPPAAEKCEAIELVQKETPVEDKTPTDEAVEATLPEEVEASAPCETPELVKSEALVSQVEEKKVESHQTVEKTEEKAEKIEVSEEKSVVAEELVQPSEGEHAEKVAKDEDIKLEETTKDVEKTEEAKLVEEKKVDETVKGSVEAPEAKVEEEKPAKVEVQNQESVKDCEDAKKTEDLAKESVPVKTQKPSLVKIMKQSLVKAKKAIIGKSQSTKTAAPEVKDDGSK